MTIEHQYACVRASVNAEREPPTLFLHELHAREAIAQLAATDGVPAAAREELSRLLREA